MAYLLEILSCRVKWLFLINQLIDNYLALEAKIGNYIALTKAGSVDIKLILQRFGKLPICHFLADFSTSFWFLDVDFFICTMFCNCGSPKIYKSCCGIYHQQPHLVPTAEALMRSRYCAYTLQAIDYIYETTLPAARKGLSKSEILNWAERNRWMGLEIIEVTECTVEFKAHYLDERLSPVVHHEKSTFKKLEGRWYYEKGEFP